MEAWIVENLEGGKIARKQPMGGSGWSSASVYVTEGGQKYFVKESRGRGLEMFLGEAKGLQAMHGTLLLCPYDLPNRATHLHCAFLGN